MTSNLSGGAFELKTGRPWTCGISPYRDREKFNLCWYYGRWFFEIDGVKYSAKKITPFIEDIQQHS